MCFDISNLECRGTGDVSNRELLLKVAAKVAAIADDCFDRPAAQKLRELSRELKDMERTPPGDEPQRA